VDSFPRARPPAGRIWNRWEVELSEAGNQEKHRRQRQLTVSEVATLPGNAVRVVDLCCGTGKITSDLLALQNVGEVLAVDINGAALDLLREKLDQHPGREKLAILQADVMHEIQCFICPWRGRRCHLY
jgi:methylase of polypeptide subunit release factors